MFRLLCLNNVTKTDIYSERVENPFLSFPARLRGGFIYCLNPDLLDLRIFLIGGKKVLIPQNEFKTCCQRVLMAYFHNNKEAYFAIRERINALVLVEGEADYGNFIRTLNAVVAKYTAILNSRLGKRGKKETENTQNNGGSV